MQSSVNHAYVVSWKSAQLEIKGSGSSLTGGTVLCPVERDTVSSSSVYTDLSHSTKENVFERIHTFFTLRIHAYDWNAAG